MQLHEIKPKHYFKKRRRRGRGGKRGTYSGRGIKGQKARAGRKLKPIIRELIKRYPKLRGYRQKSNIKKQKIIALNLDLLENNFKEGEIVNPQILLEKGLIKEIKGKTPLVKILSRGEIKKALTIENCLFSQKAKEKLEKAGSVIK
ncbi:MAG: uL15 family ribosomal protein [Minisyncoccales bacterium]